MEEKISTSVQYQVTNVKLFREVFANWSKFDSNLRQGIIAMRGYLLEMWNEVKNELKDKEEIEVKDLEKNIVLEDFNITMNKTRNGSTIFYITFPNYDYTDAASKYVAVVLTKSKLRYFTLEYSEHALTSEKCWVIGEFYVKDGQKCHINYGTSDNMRLEWFSGYILRILEAENE